MIVRVSDASGKKLYCNLESVTWKFRRHDVRAYFRCSWRDFPGPKGNIKLEPWFDPVIYSN